MANYLVIAHPEKKPREESKVGSNSLSLVTSMGMNAWQLSVALIIN